MIKSEDTLGIFKRVVSFSKTLYPKKKDETKVNFIQKKKQRITIAMSITRNSRLSIALLTSAILVLSSIAATSVKLSLLSTNNNSVFATGNSDYTHSVSKLKLFIHSLWMF
jgi:hypothetical protein